MPGKWGLILRWRAHPMVDPKFSPIAVAMLSLCGLVIAPGPAQAQFACSSGSRTGVDGSSATGTLSVACGTRATAGARQSTATVNGSSATGSFSSAFGSGANASGDTAMALGVGSTARGEAGIAIRVGSTAAARNSVAVGTGSRASRQDSLAVGTGSRARPGQRCRRHRQPGARGACHSCRHRKRRDRDRQHGGRGRQRRVRARQRGLRSPRLGGRGAVDRCRHRQPRPRPQATAIGAGSQARLSNSTAIGAGARAERADKVVLGTRTNTYTLSGLNSAASRNAQSGPTRFVTADAQENLAASTFGPATIAALDNRVDNLSRVVQDTRSEARQGIAAVRHVGRDAVGRGPGQLDREHRHVQERDGDLRVRGLSARDLDAPRGERRLAVSGSDTHAFRAGASGEF